MLGHAGTLVLIGLSAAGRRGARSSLPAPLRPKRRACSSSRTAATTAADGLPAARAMGARGQDRPRRHGHEADRARGRGAGVRRAEGGPRRDPLGDSCSRFGIVDLRDSPDEAAFRAQVRAWLAEQPCRPRRAASGAARCSTPATPGLTWPEEYGGRGAPYSHQAIALEEFARAGAPNHMNVIALGMAGPTIMAHGTEEQKQRYLAEDAVRRGDLVPGLLRARTPAPTSRPCARASSRRTATSSSTARRCGRRSRTSPTSASSSAAATRSPSVTPG